MQIILELPSKRVLDDVVKGRSSLNKAQIQRALQASEVTSVITLAAFIIIAIVAIIMLLSSNVLNTNSFLAT